MNSIQLNHVGTIKLSGAEISDFDPISQRLFVTGESANKPVLQVVDVSDANNPTQVTNIDLSSLGAGIQSVAVRKDIGTGNSIVAIAISANTSTDPGKIAFYDAVTLTKISEVTVGALPDMITFTADGSKLLVANEGEPSENYAIDPEGSISIIDVSGNIASLDNSKVTTANFTTFNGQKETLKSAGVRLFGLNATVAQDLEPEYIAISSDGKTAFVTLQENNAFAVLDIATANITKIVPLGFKNHNLPENGLDASDRDVNGTSGGGGKINIQNWPIFGMYQPDAISSFQIADKTYYITANEGDARIRPTANGTFGNEGSLFNEEARVSSLNLDPTAFPNATELKKPENLGRLTVTNKLGDTDGDGDFDQLYAYGARSFSIWDDQGKLVYDSGDQIEQILKQQTPTFFNANNGSAAEFDTRSDNKGPEPESTVVGVINGIPYGFVGLERAGGGVMVYNLSNPTAPQFVQYIRTEGDVSPEGLKFISAENSPNAKPMLAVANEVSNTVSFYEIASPPKLTTYEFQNLPKLGTTSTGQDIFLGGFSGLYFQGVADNGNLKFVTNTDRGPNGEPTGQNRPFFLPNFQPEIVSFELNQTTNQITITKRTGLFREDGKTPLTGLPNVQAGAAGTAYTDEIGVDLNGKVLPNDTLGADVEGIVIAKNGDYWLVDEYRPAIYHFDVNGKLLDRFVPQGTATATEPDQPAGTFGTEVLPAVYTQRRSNRGFEAIALEGNKLYAFIQSPIDNPDNGTDTTSRNSRNLRILEFDIISKQVTGEYLYLLDDITGSGNAKTDKIGDAVALGNGKFAVVERDDRSDNTSNKLIYQIDLATATNINNPANFTLPSGKTIEQLSAAELTTAGIIAANKTLIVNAAQVGYTGVEKLEGLALVAPNILAVINDNDFNVAGTTIPEKLGIIELPNNLPITISGTSGNDILLASASGYTLLGLAGNDSIDGVTGTGDNIFDGGEGDDEIFAKENDTALGGSGNDRLFSDGQGNNILSGGEGNDQIFPDRNDKVFGDAGNDVIFSGLGGNTLTGGDGQDIFWLANGAYLQSPNIITDFNPAQDSLKVDVEGFKNINQLTFSPQGNYTLISANSNPLAILKNYELPQFAITSASATEGNIIIFTVTRTGNNSSSQSVTVTTSIATGDTASDTDLTAKTATLTFAPGETTKTFAVQTTQDVLFEENETFTVSLSNPDNGAIVSSTNGTAKGTINNDEADAAAAAASIFSIATASATEGNGVNFTITRTGDNQSTQSVTVSTAINADDTASNNDLTQKNETLTFALGETTKTFTVQTTQDSRVEKDETFTVNLSNSTNGSIISSTNNTTKGVIINDDIPFATPNNNNYIFPIKGEGDQVRLKVSLVARNSNSINELAVFNVDDAQGNINGIAPGAAGYNQAAINRAKVVFSAISNLPNGFNIVDSVRLINFNSGDNLKFLLVKNGTIDSVNSGKTPLSNLSFADVSNQKIADFGADGFTVSWEDGSGNVADFNDLVVKVQHSNDKSVIGTGLQGGNQGEIIDLRDITSQVKVDFSVYREAAFNNEVYFYKIDNAAGQIGNLQANSANRANYLQTALNNLLKDAQTGTNIKFSAANQGIQTGTATITGGTILAPMIVVNGTLSQLLDSNANNNPQVYFPYLGINSDGVDHIRLLGNNTFGFEDLVNGGDLDYNDIIVKMNFTQVV
ncbi:choice-of-anchor I family protein [Dolichospermum sp. UHCC 0684]|uniref:choice-of-anchor I family protein n=1 Tax=unclassified Dolichospermum TaxID=2622029 RepID=UPI0016B26819|nr:MULTISPECIES: choice-of-anchor I family protein [unclassified Dolichospermum]MEA5531804.1 choice-of-anchor I family protein [Dolichospermum sp. UHCC 0684]MTJ35889.1 DUF4114 domain-containing protein [Dolichospermum sp. UHCC 0260]